MSVIINAFKLAIRKEEPLSREVTENSMEMFNFCWGKNLKKDNVTSSDSIHVLLIHIKQGSKEQASQWCQLVHSLEWTGLVSQNNYQLWQNLTTYVTGPFKDLVMVFKPKVLKFIQ